MIGYLCAYLRYYHPHEFITAYLNNAHNEDDVKNGSELAMQYGIKIVPPCFGLSKDQYIFDKSKGVIAKGLSSIKYMNASVANELYSLSKKESPQTLTFMELLTLMNETGVDTRQKDILIKIGYFSDFGNARELLRLAELFSLFKNGDMKKIQKDKLPGEIYDIVASHSDDKNKKGETMKSFTIIDMNSILNECEKHVKAQGIPDFDLKDKIQTQLELMGYVDMTTGKEEDRRKLLVMDIYPLKNKDSEQPWGYAISTRSIGSGKTSRLTVRADLYNRLPIKRLDTILAKSITKNERGFWYIQDYEMVV